MWKVIVRYGVSFSILISCIGIGRLAYAESKIAVEEKVLEGALVFDFTDIKEVDFPPAFIKRGSSVRLVPDGKYGKNAIELSYNFSTPKKVMEEVYFSIKNYKYEKDFTNYTKVSFWAKGDGTGAYLRDRIFVHFYSNVSGDKWVRYRAKVNERQEIDPDLFIESPEWKKITLDLKNGPFYKWNTAHPNFWKIFTFKHDDFPWNKVFCIHVGVEKYDSGPHKGKILFSRFVFLP